MGGSLGGSPPSQAVRAAGTPEMLLFILLAVPPVGADALKVSDSSSCGEQPEGKTELTSLGPSQGF